MTDAFFVFTAWAVALVVLGSYVAFVVARGRALSRKVPVEQRRWTSS